MWLCGQASKIKNLWAVGIWLGKTLRNDEHLVGTATGVRPCRPIWRRPEGKRFERQVLERMVGSPWEPVPPSAREQKPRAVYITVDRVARLGQTPGCDGCQHEGQPHTAACRARFSDLVQREKTLDFLVKDPKASAMTTAPTTTNALATTIAAGKRRAVLCKCWGRRTHANGPRWTS